MKVMRRATVAVFAALVLMLVVGRTAVAADFNVTASGMSAFVINTQSNPGLTLTRGQAYTFEVSTEGQHPFWIKTVPETGTASTFDDGVINNGLADGTLTFTVPPDAPATLYYQCQYHDPMNGIITIVGAAGPAKVPGTSAVDRLVLGVGLALLGSIAVRRDRRSRALEIRKGLARFSHAAQATAPDLRRCPRARCLLKGVAT